MPDAAGRKGQSAGYVLIYRNFRDRRRGEAGWDDAGGEWVQKSGPQAKPSSGRFRRAKPAGPGGAGAGLRPAFGVFCRVGKGKGGFLFALNGGRGRKSCKKVSVPRGNPYGISPAG